MTIPDLLTEFRIAAMEKGDSGGPLDPQLFERMRDAYTKLQGLGEAGRTAFARLLNDPAPTVQAWVAAELLSQGDTRALPVLRELKKLAGEVLKEESEKTPMTRKVHASFTKFQALVGPWDQVAEGAYHQLIAGTT